MTMTTRGPETSVKPCKTQIMNIYIFNSHNKDRPHTDVPLHSISGCSIWCTGNKDNEYAFIC